MLTRLCIVDTKNEVIILHVASNQLGLLKVLCHNRATQHRQLDAVRKHASQPKLTSTTVIVHA